MAYRALQKHREYAMYLRKSRKDEEAEVRGEGETLARHEKILEELAECLKVYIPKKNIYREIVSGETIEARPEMQRLLEDVKHGKFEGVLVVEVERLARGDTSDQGAVAKAFKFSSTKIITPMKTYDPDNEFDEEYFEYGLFMSRREFKTINRRLQGGRITSVKEGKFLSSVAPYGYQKVKIKNAKGYTLVPDPDQSSVVKMIYDWYVVGDPQPDGSILKLGATRIANKLNDMGIKPALNSTWSKSSVTDILKNPVYAGKIRWAYKKEEKIYKDGKLRKTRTRSSDKYILVKGLHEAIIDQITFEKAKQLMASRSNAPLSGNKTLQNPFTGLIYCGKCGQKMTRLAKNKKTPYDTIKCTNTKCDNVSSPLYLVEDVLIESLKSWLIEFKAKWDIEKLDRPYDKAIANKERLLMQLQNNTDKLLKQQERIYTLLEQGVYSTEIFIKRNDKITAEIEGLKYIKTVREDELADLKSQAEYNDVFIPKVEHILDTYNELDPAKVRNEALKEILEKFEYVKNEPNKKGNRNNKNFKLELFPRVVEF